MSVTLLQLHSPSSWSQRPRACWGEAGVRGKDSQSLSRDLSKDTRSVGGRSG